jgi:protein subunit release factor A
METEMDIEMKDLYKNEIRDLKHEMCETDIQLMDSFFKYKNSQIDAVIVEIRAGKTCLMLYIFKVRYRGS